MLFATEYDSGTRISGYAVPDGVSSSLDLCVRSGGNDIFELCANQPRPDIAASGRHHTGACGFSLSMDQIPGLADLQDLEIFELSSNVLIYRRPNMRFLPRKVLRLETHMLPLWRLDKAISPFFQYSVDNIEKYGKETTTQFFLMHNVPSVYLSGKILYRNYNFYIDEKFECIVLLQDPFEEMAERILILGHMKQATLSHMGERDTVSLQPAVAYFADTDITDEAAVHLAFKDLPDDVAAILSDPLVRQFSTTLPGERAGKRGVTAALDVLTSFAIVSLRSESDRFLDATAELLGIDPALLPPIPGFGKVPVLADMLRRSRNAGYLIEKDRELFSHIAGAVQKASNVNA